MTENTFKIGNRERGRSIFRFLEEKLKLKSNWDDGLPVKYAPHVLFCTILCIIYIGNSHYAESSQRELNKLKIEVEDLRADYTTLKSDYMHAKLQSEVAKRVAVLGLEESSDPPFKMVIEK
jgi:hypothetical protein